MDVHDPSFPFQFPVGVMLIAFAMALMQISDVQDMSMLLRRKQQQQRGKGKDARHT